MVLACRGMHAIAKAMDRTRQGTIVYIQYALISWNECASMPRPSKPKNTSKVSNAAEVGKAKDHVAGVRPTRSVLPIDWDRGVVSGGGGVATTIDAIRRTRGPNRHPTKELVAIRIDRDVLAAFRAGGPGWQTRINAALRSWLVRHAKKS